MKLEPKPIQWNKEQRTQLMAAIYEALVTQMECPFKGKSQWYYVYRMLMERQVFVEDKYSAFTKALKDAGVPASMLPNTTTFSVKKSSIISTSVFPNWELKSGKRIDVLEVGTAHARVSYNVLKEFKKLVSA